MTFSFARRGTPWCARVLSLLALMAPLGSLAAQGASGTIRGRVTDAANGRGVGEVQVTVAGTRLGAMTNAEGEYTLSQVPVGPRQVVARRLGYQPVTRNVAVTDGANSLDITLNVSAVNLSEVVVTGTGDADGEAPKIGTSIAAVDST